MALKQINSGPFPYRATANVNSAATADARYFEFERTAFLHSLSVYCSAEATVSVSFTYPSTFTNGGEISNWVEIFNGIVGTSGFFMAPGAISSSPVTPTSATAPLPAAFPKGSVLRVVVAYIASNSAEAEIFLVASA